MTPATNTQHSCPYTEGGDDLALFETAPATAFEGLPSLPRDAHRRCDPPVSNSRRSYTRASGCSRPVPRRYLAPSCSR